MAMVAHIILQEVEISLAEIKEVEILYAEIIEVEVFLTWKNRREQWAFRAIVDTLTTISQNFTPKST